MLEASVTLASAVRYNQMGRACVKDHRKILRLRAAYVDLPKICRLVGHNASILLDWDVLLDKANCVQVV